jgi:hypothetical protein
MMRNLTTMAFSLSALLGLGACVEVPQPAPQQAYMAGPDELIFVADQPEMVIDGMEVFFLYTPDGWGFWDAGHHWHRAPAGVIGRLETRYPHGNGLRPSQQAMSGARPAARGQTASPAGGQAAQGGQAHPATAATRAPVSASTGAAAAAKPATGSTGSTTPRPTATAATTHPAATPPQPAAKPHPPEHPDKDCSKQPHCP